MTVTTGTEEAAGVGIEPAGGNTNSMNEYYSWNQLTKTVHNGKTASYSYNGDGLRMSKTVDGTTTRHIWDGTNIAGDVTNGTVTKYIRGIQLISSKTGSNESFYTYNAHGDVVQLTNGSGNITKQYSYDAFGVEQNKDANDTNPFRYCGEYFDDETESVYLRARYYSPVSGRFITEDPIMDGLNWYSYATNNPIAFIDPLGTNDVPIYDNDSTVIDVKYDLRELVSLVGGVLKVDGNIVKIKALGKITEINIQEVAKQDKNLRVEDRHMISDHLHYTLKDFLNLIGADYSIETVQMTVTSGDVRYQKWSQRAGKTAMKVLEGSASSVVAAAGVIGQAITSFASLFDGWGGNYNEILTEGFYKKQFIEIYDEHGKGVIINYIVPRPTAYSNNNLGIYVKELWNADMNEMAWAGWKYP